MAEVICLSSDRRPAPARPARHRRTTTARAATGARDDDGAPREAPRVSKPAEGGPPRASTRAPALRAPSARAPRGPRADHGAAAERARKARRRAFAARRRSPGSRADERERRVRPPDGTSSARSPPRAHHTRRGQFRARPPRRVDSVKDDAGTRRRLAVAHEEPLIRARWRGGTATRAKNPSDLRTTLAPPTSRILRATSRRARPCTARAPHRRALRGHVRG